ncbi:MAG: glutaminase A [Clostridia bacterium]|nr:glutaminase A [Clostridia bacterium]
MQVLLDKIVEDSKKLTAKGKVASYIPELSKADASHVGIAIVQTNGKIRCAGDYMTKFTIQSVSKPIVLLQALMDNGEEEVFSRVGMEPTGDPFNSIIRLETFDGSKPLNPMINAGAIAVSSLIKGKDNAERFDRMMTLFKQLSNNPDLTVNEDVFMSEKLTGDRNRAMGYFMKDLGSIRGNVEEVLDLYFRQCSIEVNCMDIANIGAFFANHGRDLVTGEQIVPVRYMNIVKTVMMTCGMYDASGEFAVNVGVPAKSGVGGGIMCAVPNRMGIGTFGPSLDKKGNSIAGLNVLSELSKELQLSIF